MDDKEKERQKRIDQIRKQIHPHDDEPDPTAYMGNYNFPQMLFAFCLGCATMFVASVNEIDKFKGCPLPEYFQNESRSILVRHVMQTPWCLGVMGFFLVFVPIIGMHLVHKYGWEHWEPFTKKHVQGGTSTKEE